MIAANKREVRSFPFPQPASFFTSSDWLKLIKKFGCLYTRNNPLELMRLNVGKLLFLQGLGNVIHFLKSYDGDKVDLFQFGYEHSCPWFGGRAKSVVC